MNPTPTMEAASGYSANADDTFSSTVQTAVAHVVEYSPGYKPVTLAEVEAGRYYGYDSDGDGVNAFSGV